MVISWNVLHMIHEINYTYDASPVVNRYRIKENWANEKSRLSDITQVLSNLLVQYSTTECFICLQEVPGDLLPMLHEMIQSHVGSVLANKPTVHMRTYSREPRIRGQQGGVVYGDPSESLVTIHYDPHAVADDSVYWTPCPADPGKAALTVKTVSGLSVVNTHVPFNDAPARALLADIRWPDDHSLFVLVGDINRRSSNLMKMIAELQAEWGSPLQLCSIATDKPTRAGLSSNGTLQKSWIDHYVLSAPLRDRVMPPAIVYDEVGDISDHYPISLRFQ